MIWSRLVGIWYFRRANYAFGYYMICPPCGLCWISISCPRCDLCSGYYHACHVIYVWAYDICPLYDSYCGYWVYIIYLPYIFHESILYYGYHVTLCHFTNSKLRLSQITYWNIFGVFIRNYRHLFFILTRIYSLLTCKFMCCRIN